MAKQRKKVVGYVKMSVGNITFSSGGRKTTLDPIDYQRTEYADGSVRESGAVPGLSGHIVSSAIVMSRRPITADKVLMKVGMSVTVIATNDGGKTWSSSRPRVIEEIQDVLSLVQLKDSKVWDAPRMGDNRFFANPTKAIRECRRRERLAKVGA